MTTQEISTYLELNNKFLDKCKKIASKMSKVNSEFGSVDTFYIDSDNNSRVNCYGIEWWRGEREEYSADFDVALLTYTDEALDAYVDKLYQEKLERESAAKKKAEAESLAYKMAQYEKLKEELGL